MPKSANGFQRSRLRIQNESGFRRHLLVAFFHRGLASLFHVALFIHAEALYVDFVADFDDVL
jgi:hypothetical protein